MHRSVMAEAREQSTLEELHSSDGVLGGRRKEREEGGREREDGKKGGRGGGESDEACSL